MTRFVPRFIRQFKTLATTGIAMCCFHYAMIIVLSCFACVPIIAQEPSIAAIRSHYQNAVSPIERIEGNYRITHTTGGGSSWKHQRSGGKFKLAETLENGVTPPASIWNGTYYSNITEAEASRRLVQFRNEIPKTFHMNYVPDHFAGVTLLHTSSNLASILASEKLVCDGIVERNKKKLWKFSLAELKTLYGTNVKFSVEFDPAHEFLPSRISYFSPKDSWSCELIVDEFHKVINEATGKPIWFPKVARVFQGEGANEPKFVVDSLKINPQIDEGIFDPVIEKGTQLLDVDRQSMFEAESSARLSDVANAGREEKRGDE